MSTSDTSPDAGKKVICKIIDVEDNNNKESTRRNGENYNGKYEDIWGKDEKDVTKVETSGTERTAQVTIETDDTEDIDPFAYEPLKPTRKTKNPRQPIQNTKRPKKSMATPAKPTGPGLVEMFSAMKKTPEKCRLPPTVCPLCQLPLELLQSRVSYRLHLEDCQDKMSETNLAPLPSCRDDVDCQSREVAHYAQFE